MTSVTKPFNQLVILSGKGGTGKTTLTAALMHLISQSPSGGVFVDADVDAANLALVSQAQILESHFFTGSQVAIIDTKQCSRCGHCFDVCRFNAVHKPKNGNEKYQINALLCEGCAACYHVCPESAIHMNEQTDGEWYHSLTPYGHQFHAGLFPAAENSGKLVTLIKQHAKLFAQDHQLPLMIVDGPPGIGCPVISASAGADLALLVAEPGVSGLHDLERIIQTLKHFRIPALVSINKADLYPRGKEEIYRLASEMGYQVIGEIPFDDAIPKAMVNALPVTRYSPESPSSQAIRRIWEGIRLSLSEKEMENGGD